MDKLIQLTLILHIICGTLALIAAPFAVVLRKKTPKHRVAGRIYFYSMLAVTVTALVMAIVKNIPFLLMVAVFSFYAIWDARRALAQKQLHKGLGVKWYDWVVAIVTLLFNTALMVFGAYYISKANDIGYIALIFGTIGVVNVGQSLYRMKKPPTQPMHWLYRHITGMIAGYIATLTAFLAVNVTFLPALVVWLAPTVIGSATIAWIIARYKTGKETL